jgi:hypothetical protein
MKHHGYLSALCIAALSCALAAGEPEKARAEEFVYEGKTATDWARELKAGNPKASHALSRLGKDAVRPLIDLLKDPDEKTSTTAAAVLGQLQLDKATLPSFLTLLKDDHFEVRRTAVRLLGKFATQDAAVSAALTEMLNDRDRAVAEVAEEALRSVEIEPLVNEAYGSLKQGDIKRAMVLSDKILALNPQEKRALEVKVRAQEMNDRFRADQEKIAARMDDDVKGMAKKKTMDALLMQARDMMAKGELERPMRIVAEAQKLYPEDPSVNDLRRKLEIMMKERALKKAEGEAFDRVDKEGGDKLKRQKKVGEDGAEF